MTSFHTELSGRTFWPRIVAQVILPLRMLKVPIAVLIIAVAAQLPADRTIRVSVTVGGAPASGVQLTIARPSEPGTYPSLPEATETLRGYLESIGPPPAGLPNVIAMTRTTTPAALDQDPALVQNVMPTYTDDARGVGLQGFAEAKIAIQEDGTVGNIELIRRLGFGLDQKVVDALKQWKFKPAMKDGNAVGSTMTVTVNFTLASASRPPTPVATTDTTGNAILTNLPSGRFVLIAKRDGLVGIARVVMPAVNPSASISLVPASSIRGQVRDSSGAPLAGFHVNLGLRSEQTFIEGATTLTDAAGRFSFPSVMPGDFYFRVKPPAPSPVVYYPASPDFERAVSVPVEAGKEIVGIDVEVR